LESAGFSGDFFSAAARTAGAGFFSDRLGAAGAWAFSEGLAFPDAGTPDFTSNFDPAGATRAMMVPTGTVSSGP
jgi:hypothetical protein